MKSKAKSRIIVLITLGIFFSSIPIFSNATNLSKGNYDCNSGFSNNSNFGNENPKISAISAKIHIDDEDPSSDWIVAKAAGICSGLGTRFNPYIIEDLIIDGGGSGSCIFIENSDVFFIIRNCSVTNSGNYFSQISQKYDGGISLLNVENAIIIDNTAFGNYPGVVLCSSNNNTVSGNIVISNFGHGIILYSSRYNTISGNIVTNNLIGIYLDNCWFNNVSGNTDNYNVVAGIYLTDSSFNDILENSANCNSYGIYLFGDCRSNTFSRNTINNNSNHGINLYYGSQNIFSENTVNDNAYHGIYLYTSNANTISENVLNYNIDSGICLSVSDSNTISRNTAFNNYYAVILSQSNSNIIRGNKFVENDVCIYEDEGYTNFIVNNDCGYGGKGRMTFDLVIVTFLTSVGIAIIFATTLLRIRRRKRN